ncbi:MAG: Flp pilus assembly complex ATPase component TadA [Planctomycetes bacterium]|nr:Flp pilus assembly complex ATPase component TadA [Planctomycetota bacterium]
MSARADQEKKSLVTLLLEEKVVDEGALIAAIARASNIPPIDLARVQVEDECLQIINRETALHHGVFPVAKAGDVLTVAVADPFNVVKLDDLRLITQCTLRPVVSTDKAIRDAVEKAFKVAEKQVEKMLEGIEGDSISAEAAEAEQAESYDISDVSSEDSPVVKVANAIIAMGLKMGASDIHMEPYEKRFRVRMRVDGVMRECPKQPPKALQNGIISRIKIMSRLDIAERMKPQDGKFQIKFERRQIDFRVSTLPIVHGEKVVMRVLDTGKMNLALDSLGFEPIALQHYRDAINQPYGMILVTGPTGSGKSTTLYSAVQEIATPDINLVTVEDPVEYQMEGINQVPVNPKRGMTFAAALRSILRQDPDVILMGEIRDKETIEIAVKAALTGHLVLSTIHTNDAPSTITRMVDMGLDPFMVASSTVLISAQRLLRKLCEHCKEPVEYPEERLRAIGFIDSDFERGLGLMKAVGCQRCSGGYRGRFAILETMYMSEALKRMVVENKPVLDLKAKAVAEGMLTLRRTGILNATRGKTTIEEVLRITSGDD